MELLSRIREVFGSQAELARQLGITPPAISHWGRTGKAGRRPSPRMCVQIERLSGQRISRAELREDWRQLWPELDVSHR